MPPTTAVLGESVPPTPERPMQDSNIDSTISAVTNRLIATNIVADPTKPKPSINTTGNHNRQPSASGPLKSIVEDLKDKVHTSFTVA